MTLERVKRSGLIIFCCDSPGCHEFVQTHTDEFSEALTMLRAERWTTDRRVDRSARSGWSYGHFCQQCSDEIARVKEDAMDSLLKGVPKK